MWSESEYSEWLNDPYSMNGEEIASALDYSRQNVSQLLKRGLAKCYLYVSRTQKDMKPFEIATFISKMFNIGEGPEEIAAAEAKKFFKLFPPDIRRKIKQDARERFNIM